jgi:hypothetical protein
MGLQCGKLIAPLDNRVTNYIQLKNDCCVPVPILINYCIEFLSDVLRRMLLYNDAAPAAGKIYPAPTLLISKPTFFTTYF